MIRTIFLYLCIHTYYFSKMKRMTVMKKLLLFSLLLLHINAMAQGIEAFVNQQMTAYPESHLLDIYKSCFQDYMGAEHLVPDSEKAKAYLMKELATVNLNELQPWYYEYCGVDGRYVRLSLRTVLENRITTDVLLDAFIRSANARKRPSVGKFARRWHKIIDTIEDMNLDLPDYEREKLFLDSIIAKGKYATSHSEAYRKAYNPHYRIVERSIFEKELMPLLQRD